MNEAPLGFALIIPPQYSAAFLSFVSVVSQSALGGSFLHVAHYVSAVSKLCLPCGQLLVPYISRSGQSAVICLYFREHSESWLDSEDDCWQ